MSNIVLIAGPYRVIIPRDRPAIDYDMLSHRQLLYFVTIVEQGSFSRAAEVLHVAQPALSHHVRNMEQRLGTALLFRTPRGAEPTEAGVILLRHARAVIERIAVAEDEIRGHASDPAGDVRLGLPGTISQILAVPLIRAVHDRYPKIRLRIAEALSGFVLDWMRESRIDLAVLYNKTREHGIATEHVLDEDLVFFGSPVKAATDNLPASGNSVAFRSLVRLPLILPAEGHGLRHLLQEHATTAGLALSTIVDVDSYNNIRALVMAGMGYSILPQNAIAEDVAAARLVAWPIADPHIRRSVHLAHSTDRPMSIAVTAVLEMTRDLLRAQVSDGVWAGARLADD